MEVPPIGRTPRDKPACNVRTVALPAAASQTPWGRYRLLQGLCAHSFVENVKLNINAHTKFCTTGAENHSPRPRHWRQTASCSALAMPCGPLGLEASGNAQQNFMIPDPR